MKIYENPREFIVEFLFHCHLRARRAHFRQPHLAGRVSSRSIAHLISHHRSRPTLRSIAMFGGYTALKTSSQAIEPPPGNQNAPGTQIKTLQVPLHTHHRILQVLYLAMVHGNRVPLLAMVHLTDVLLTLAQVQIQALLSITVAKVLFLAMVPITASRVLIKAMVLTLSVACIMAKALFEAIDILVPEPFKSMEIHKNQ